MVKTKAINGWSKKKIIERIDRAFKGKATGKYGECRYLTECGKKCVVGLFIPDGHIGSDSFAGVRQLVECYPDLVRHMPLNKTGMVHFQKKHDTLVSFITPLQQKRELIAYIEEHVLDDSLIAKFKRFINPFSRQGE